MGDENHEVHCQVHHTAGVSLGVAVGLQGRSRLVVVSEDPCEYDEGHEEDNKAEDDLKIGIRLRLVFIEIGIEAGIQKG